jgi:hypothetical protein
VEGRADDERHIIPTLSSERFETTHHESLGFEVVALVYCYVGCDTDHALMVSTSKSHTSAYKVALIDFATVTL